ncbi:GNAT family N-acetyltransferase [Yimella sp. cx-51]|uniref:GNAT family N-acetyltransferase n=1 Tax=Yimella sp. cx-51 TaxID=2770551 RepID=UPI001AD866D9|nr:N-acetyltransferase [Yimella sp. cx-51]QTH37226.1 N-acetyltransferase [Yimella sp. cx-51]
MIIRRERRTDFAAIKRVVAEAFKSEVEADLVDRIRESPQYRPDLSFVAVDGGEVVGHVMIDGCVVRNSQGERPIVMLSTCGES